MSNTPPKEFYSDASKILEYAIKEIGTLDTQKGLLQKGSSPMNGKPRFSKSCSIARDNLSKMEKQDKSNFSLYLNIADLYTQYTPSFVNKTAFDIINNMNFKAANKSSNFLKRLFQKEYIYKFIGSDHIMIFEGTVKSSDNGYETIWLRFKCADNNDKTKKALRLVEAVDIDTISDIFSEASFI